MQQKKHFVSTVRAPAHDPCRMRNGARGMMSLQATTTISNLSFPAALLLVAKHLMQWSNTVMSEQKKSKLIHSEGHEIVS